MKDHYLLTCWSGKKGSDEGEFIEIECVVSEETINNLISEKPNKFIKVLIEDGEIAIIPTDNIHSLIQDSRLNTSE